MAIFRAEIVSDGFPCSYNSALAILVIAIWKLVQVSNIVLDCAFCFPSELANFFKQLYYENLEGLEEDIRVCALCGASNSKKS